MSEYSNYKMVKVELTTEKAFLAIIENFTEKPIWIPKSVVGPDRRVKQWFIDQKDKELKDFQRTKKQSGLEDFI